MPPAATTTEAARPVGAAQPGFASGVRPSSGAAVSASSGGSALPPVLDRSELAAPEDRRTPARLPPVFAATPGGSAVLVAGGALAAVAGLLLYCFDPRRYHFYPVCFFHQTTGLLCPGCGALRGMHQLLHGHLAAAFYFNPMLMVSLPFCFMFGARFALQAARRQPLSLGLRPAWLWLFLAAVLAVSVLRNLPGAPFALLRP